MKTITKEPTDFQVVNVMQNCGGAFARQLAVLWLNADRQDRTRIQCTWSDVWERYLAVARDQITDQNKNG